jgi:hypothetical protein
MNIKGKLYYLELHNKEQRSNKTAGTKWSTRGRE